MPIITLPQHTYTSAANLIAKVDLDAKTMAEYEATFPHDRRQALAYKAQFIHLWITSFQLDDSAIAIASLRTNYSLGLVTKYIVALNSQNSDQYMMDGGCATIPNTIYWQHTKLMTAIINNADALWLTQSTAVAHTAVFFLKHKGGNHDVFDKCLTILSKYFSTVIGSAPDEVARIFTLIFQTMPEGYASLLTLICQRAAAFKPAVAQLQKENALLRSYLIETESTLQHALNGNKREKGNAQARCEEITALQRKNSELRKQVSALETEVLKLGNSSTNVSHLHATAYSAPVCENSLQAKLQSAHARIATLEATICELKTELQRKSSGEADNASPQSPPIHYNTFP